MWIKRPRQRMRSMAASYSTRACLMFTNRKPIATSRNSIQAAFLASLGIALAACGGSGGGDSAPAMASVVSQGVVTAKGSVFVNGIEYSTSGAVIRIDDN